MIVNNIRESIQYNDLCLNYFSDIIKNYSYSTNLCVFDVNFVFKIFMKIILLNRFFYINFARHEKSRIPSFCSLFHSLL